MWEYVGLSRKINNYENNGQNYENLLIKLMKETSQINEQNNSFFEETNSSNN